MLLALGFLAATAGALAFRLPQLALRPMHCDEANQALKAAMLLETGRYRYDPQEHHGPLLYYATLPSLRLSGARNFAESREFDYRIVPVLFGAGLILLLPLVADGLGRMPALFAGLLTAISPAMVFYSRYYIQEMLLVFLTFAAIASAWRYLRSRSVLWAAATGVLWGLMAATKETWVLAAAAMGVGLALALAWGAGGTASGRTCVLICVRSRYWLLRPPACGSLRSSIPRWGPIRAARSTRCWPTAPISTAAWKAEAIGIPGTITCKSLSLHAHCQDTWGRKP